MKTSSQSHKLFHAIGWRKQQLLSLSSLVWEAYAVSLRIDISTPQIYICVLLYSEGFITYVSKWRADIRKEHANVPIRLSQL